MEANQDRLCEPIAQTSEADGDNAAEAAILNSSESLAPAGIEVTDSKAISDGRAEIEVDDNFLNDHDYRHYSLNFIHI